MAISVNTNHQEVMTGPAAEAKLNADFTFPYDGRPKLDEGTSASNANSDPNKCHWRGWYKCGDDPWRDFWGNGSTCDEAMTDALDWAEDQCGGQVAYNKYDCTCN